MRTGLGIYVEYILQESHSRMTKKAKEIIERKPMKLKKKISIFRLFTITKKVMTTDVNNKNKE